MHPAPSIIAFTTLSGLGFGGARRMLQMFQKS